LTTYSLDGYKDAVTLLLQGEPTGSVVNFGVNPVTPTMSTTLTLGSLNTVSPGYYTIDVLGTSPTETHTTTLGLGAFSQEPVQVSLTTPITGAVNQPQRPTFTWAPVGQGETYRLEIATDMAFTSPIVTRTVSGVSYTLDTDLDTASIYYWRVKAFNTCGDGDFSDVWRFITAPAPDECAVGAARNEVYSDDFENGVGEWDSGGITSTWQITDSIAYSGSFAFYAVDIPTIGDQRLTTPEIALPFSPGDNLTLQYWNWQDFESGLGGCYDGGILEISTDGGITWTQLLNDVLLTTPYDAVIPQNFRNPLAGLNAWCSDAQTWVKSVVDLNAYAGQTVQFRYRLGTDTSVGREGWYLDDFQVQQCSATQRMLYFPLIMR